MSLCWLVILTVDPNRFVLFLGINRASCGAKGVLVFLESIELFGLVEPLCQVGEASFLLNFGVN